MCRKYLTNIAYCYEVGWAQKEHRGESQRLGQKSHNLVKYNLKTSAKAI